LNEAVEAALDELLKTFDMVHLCGQGKLDDTAPRPGYVRFEYVNEQMADVLALADVVVSRAGANAVFELLALNKPAVLVPLPLEASRGDQILNAQYFERNGYAVHLPQAEATPEKLTETVLALYHDRQKYIDAMAAAPGADGTENILRLIFRAVQA
jgi:UDP-N-acetylglucosamine--N-acetylmuramyl-(pentapeptide) pyrophosphoryl-undecaprenol N-acetylglucosamine transferase